MGNTILTPQVLANELLMRLKNNLGFAGAISSHWEDEFANKGRKIGDNIDLRVPVRFSASDGAALVPQDVEERSVSLKLNYHKHVGFKFAQRDLTLDIDRFAEKYLDSASVTLANQFDSDALDYAYKSVSNAVGSPGTIPNAIKTYAQASAKLNKGGCPIDSRRFNVISSDMQVEIVDALKGTFNDQKALSQQYLKGRMGIAYGMTWIEDQNVRTHTVGAQGGASPLVAGAGQTGYSVTTDGWTSAVAVRLKKGDIVKFDGVYAVNPVSGDQLADQKQFVLAADASSDVSGNLTMTFVYPLITSGPYKTCSGSPADNAAITVEGAANARSPQGMVFHKSAFTKVSLPFELPKGVQMAARSIDPETGLCLTMVQQFDINTYQTFTRVDILYGFATPIPEFACRVQS